MSMEVINMKLNLPNDVELILRKTGGYIVGGCVRDILLGKEPSDYDFTGSMRPSEVIALFSTHLTLPFSDFIDLKPSNPMFAMSLLL